MTSESFHHQPLDHAIQSIRLVHLARELSSDGLIQCTMRHTTTTAHYVCLSYRWGECDSFNQNVILINGKRFLVQQNLLDFLSTMQSTGVDEDAIFHSEIGYWIDALCIDQQNTSERNHQVAQMGSIYSRADYVHVWLGKVQDAGRIRLLLAGPAPDTSLGAWASQVRQHMKFIDGSIFHNPYWTRAWVIQEIVLAQRVEVSLDTERFEFTQLTQNIRNFCLDWAGTHFAHFAFDSQGSEQFRNQSLVKLLDHFSEKECSLGYDRVFSLLALCEAGKAVPVSYDLSGVEIAYHILKSEPADHCICSTRVIAHAIRLEESFSWSDFDDMELSLIIELVGFEVEFNTNLEIVSLRLKYSTSEEGWRWGSLTQTIAEGYTNRWAGCVDHWLSHFTEALTLHLRTAPFPTRKGIGVQMLRLSDLVSNQEYFVPDERTSAKEVKTAWRHLSPGLLIRAPHQHENICIMRIPIKTLLRNCLHKPKLCSNSDIYYLGPPEAAVPRITLELR